jgi:hypothetical protein
MQGWQEWQEWISRIFVLFSDGPVEGYFEHGNEPSGSMKCWEVLEYFF